MDESEWKTMKNSILDSFLFPFHKLTFIHRERERIDLSDWGTFEFHCNSQLLATVQRATIARDTWTILKSEKKNLDENLCSVFRFFVISDRQFGRLVFFIASSSEPKAFTLPLSLSSSIRNRILLQYRWPNVRSKWRACVCVIIISSKNVPKNVSTSNYEIIV